MKVHAEAFRKQHSHTHIKNNKLYSEMKIQFSIKSFLEKWIKDNNEKINSMGITKITSLH